jgi:oligopeptide transport system substrate-binding protein
LGAERYAELLADQRAILRAAFARHNGREIDTQGDSFFASFPRATEAVAASVEIQRTLAAYDWPKGVEVRVRMGLHTGEPRAAEEGYVGLDVHRAARIAHVGHGGQVLLSETTAGLLKRNLPEGIDLKELGVYQLKDLRTNWHLHQLVIADLPSEFPKLKAKLVQPPADPTTRKPFPIPAFLEADAAEVESEQKLFVAREQELERLDRFLEQTTAGQGQVAFVSGGPGRGKTALLQAFTRRAMAHHPDLLVASGQCNAFTGSGDPYLPFMDVLAMLTGDVQSRWAAGAISTSQARRAWSALPEVIEALIENGPNLVDVFIRSHPLLDRAGIAAPDAHWLIELRELSEGNLRSSTDWDQTSLFSQVEQVLRAVSRGHPLLLTLDDLQWADAASMNLLFHLGRRLGRDRVMILGDFRPEEVAVGRDGKRHPLEKVLAEFKRQYGKVLIELGEEKAGDLAFIDAYLDSEPNHFPGEFREALFAHTEGHPLFTIELLRDLRERGVLIQDNFGCWIVGTELNWNVLPSKVEGVIGERIGRLEKELRDILAVASVEGESFTAQVVARAQKMQELDLLRRLNRDLDQHHRLIWEQGLQTVADRQLNQYRFRHSLFRQHLYNGLPVGERGLLHAEVGEALESFYEKQSNEIASQLAWHFSEAGEKEKAIDYHLLAGDQARRVYAYEEAVEHYEKSVAYLKLGENHNQTARALMKLGQTYHSIPDYRQAQRVFQDGFSIWQKVGEGKSSTKLPDAPHELRVAWGTTPRMLDPGKSGTTEDRAVIEQLFSGMTELSPEGDVMPAVARAWEIQENGRKYTFHLREDVFWSDGSLVKAEDFEFAWKRSSAHKSFHSIYAADESTLMVELDRPISYFLNLLNKPHYYPVPRTVVEKYGDAWTRPENIISNGAYLLESWQHEKTLVLTQNPSYYGRIRGNVKRIELEVRNPSTDQAILYRDDQFDMIAVEPEVEYIRTQSPDELLVVPRLGTWFVRLNISRAPLNNPLVRQALAMAIDKEKLVTEMQRGLSTPAYGGLLPPSFPGHRSEIGLPFDPEKARRFIVQAGYPDGRGFPELSLGTHAYRENLANYLCMQWQDHLNLKIGLNTYPFTSTAEAIKHPLSLNGWVADYTDPASFLLDAHEAVWTWLSEKYTDLVRRTEQIIDRQERIRQFQEAENVLINEANLIPLFYTLRHWMIKPWVKLYTPPYLLTDLFINFKDVVIEPHP